MAKSVRISDDIYALAQSESVLGTRSLAQQIEHWVKIGLALERADSDKAREAVIGFQRLAHEIAVYDGRKAPAALLSIPASVAKAANVVLPTDAYGDAKGW